jgi:short-subunit dehydrogenase
MTNAVLPQMRAQGSGRIVNISSVFGFMPAPYMAIYAATKYAVEGYSESVDHAVREHGIRVALVEPAGTRTGFDDNSPAPANPLDAYTRQRQTAAEVLTDAVNNGLARPKPSVRPSLPSPGHTSIRVRFPPSRLGRHCQ